MIIFILKGTRSTTGQLLPFKKGPFYMWEQLNVPIVPVIFYGAYELYPVGSWVNNTGKVYVRYLDPILPSEAKDRDGMMRLARRRMLEAFLDTPGPIGLDLDWSIRLFSIFAIVSVVVADYFWWILVRDVFLRRLGYSVGSLTIGSILVVVAITLFLYVYNVYLINLGGGDGNRNGSSTNGALKIKTKGANNSETEKTLDEKSSLVDKK